MSSLEIKINEVENYLNNNNEISNTTLLENMLVLMQAIQSEIAGSKISSRRTIGLY